MSEANKTGLSNTLRHILAGGVFETAAGLERIRWKVTGLTSNSEEAEEKIRGVLNSDSFRARLEGVDSNQEAAGIIAIVLQNIGCDINSEAVLKILNNGCF